MDKGPDIYITDRHTQGLELILLMKDISDFFNSCRVMDFLTDDTSTYRDLGAIFKTQYSPFNDVSDNQFTCTLSLTSVEKEAKI